MNLLSSRQYIPAYDGNRDAAEDHQVSLTIKRLTIRDSFQLQAKIRESLGFDSSTPNQIATLNLQDAVQLEKFWGAIEWALPKFTENWHGVKVDGREVVEAAEVVQVYGQGQLPYLVEVMTELLTGGEGTAAESKNSQPESEPKNSGSGSIASPVSPEVSSESETAEIGI